MVLVTTQQTVDTLKNLGKREDRQSLVLSPCTFGRERSGFILITHMGARKWGSGPHDPQDRRH